jgi:hypothetical protein
VRCDVLTTGTSEDYSLRVSRTEQFFINSTAFRIKQLLPSLGCFLEVETSEFIKILVYCYIDMIYGTIFTAVGFIPAGSGRR